MSRSSLPRSGSSSPATCPAPTWSSLLLCSLLFLVVLVLAACPQPYYGGGGGGGGDDDDNGGTGDTELTFGLGNQTGYDFTNGTVTMSGPNGTDSFDFGAIPDGDSAVDSSTIENAQYGEILQVFARAVDIDGDCYDWPEPNTWREYEIGPTLDINIVFTFDHWLGGGCP